MITANQFKNGLTIDYDAKVYQIIEFQHIKPGKGGAFVRTKLRDLDSGAIIDKTFRAGEKFKTAYVEQQKVQYLYNTADIYYFMNTESFEQIDIDKLLLGGSVDFLKEGMELEISFCKGRPIRAGLPIFVELKVVHTEPGARGDTSRAPSKPVKLETGAVVQAPLFINKDDVIKIDTRTGKYVERV